MLEYDSKGYMYTGGQSWYTGFKGQRNSSAHVALSLRGAWIRCMPVSSQAGA